MYAFWEAADLKRAIISLEQQMALGVSQVAAPGNEGSALMVSRSNADIILGRLYRAYERKTGETIDREKMRTQIKTYQITVDPKENLR